MKKILCMLILFNIPILNFGFDWQSLKTSWDETPLSTKVLAGVVVIGAAGFYCLHSKHSKETPQMSHDRSKDIRVEGSVNKELQEQIGKLKEDNADLKKEVAQLKALYLDMLSEKSSDEEKCSSKSEGKASEVRLDNDFAKRLGQIEQAQEECNRLANSVSDNFLKWMPKINNRVQALEETAQDGMRGGPERGDNGLLIFKEDQLKRNTLIKRIVCKLFEELNESNSRLKRVEKGLEEVQGIEEKVKAQLERGQKKFQQFLDDFYALLEDPDRGLDDKAVTFLTKQVGFLITENRNLVKQFGITVKRSEIRDFKLKIGAIKDGSYSETSFSEFSGSSSDDEEKPLDKITPEELGRKAINDGNKALDDVGDVVKLADQVLATVESQNNGNGSDGEFLDLLE